MFENINIITRIDLLSVILLLHVGMNETNIT